MHPVEKKRKKQIKKISGRGRNPGFLLQGKKTGGLSAKGGKGGGGV